MDDDISSTNTLVVMSISFGIASIDLFSMLKTNILAKILLLTHPAWPPIVDAEKEVERERGLWKRLLILLCRVR